MKRLMRIFILVLALSLAHVSPAQGDSLPDSAYIDGVIGHAQGYSLSCEARSAADLAAFWGLSFTETEFLEALPRAENPDLGFVGHPGDAWGNIPPASYGVHARPVADALQDFGLRAEAHAGLSWDDLRGEIEAGHPVIVWVIGQMWAGTPVEFEAPDGSTAVVAAFEHTMILTGYGPDYVQVVDAYSGQYQTYWLDTFLKSWAVLGNMAVFGSLELPNADASPPGAQAGTYTVQEGDFLVELAQRFNTTWQQLAEVNSIGYPFTIYPGQVLQLPGGDEPERKLEEKAAGISAPPAGQPGSFTAHLPVIERNYVTTVIQAKASAKTLAGPGGSALYLPYIVHLGQLPGLR